MRYWKRFLFYLMMMLIFTLSFSKDENRITIFEKNNEPAKLKIGVTKVITKELPMDYHYEKKLVYCELPESVGENDTIYVSETLDEIPSISTTSGRKTINNIAKYLTKDIKANSKFNYRIITKADEKTGAEKKYIVIHCKEQAQNIYLYVVDKATYRMKELYRGKFFITYEEQKEENIDYGAIRFKSNNTLKNNDIISSQGTGEDIYVNDTLQSSNPDTGVVGQLTTKGFPKKYLVPGGLGAHRSKVVIKFGTGTIAETKEMDFSFKDGLFDLTLPLNLVGENLRDVRENIRIYTESKSDFIKIQLKNWDNNFSAISLPIEIEYYYRAMGEDFKLRKKDSFTLAIESKTQNQGINKESSINIKPTTILHNKATDLIYDGKKVQFVQNGKVIENSERYINISRGYLEKAHFDKDVTLQIIQNDKIIASGIPVKADGTFTTNYIDLDSLEYKEKIGKMLIKADSKDQYLVYNVEITSPYRDKTVNEFKLRYTDKNNNILKVDQLQLNITPAQEEAFEERTGGIYVTDAGGLNEAYITAAGDASTQVIVIKDTDKEHYNPNGKAKIIGNYPKRVEIDPTKHDWQGEKRVLVTNESENKGSGEATLAEDGSFTTLFDDRNGIILSSNEDHSSVGGLIKEKVVRIGIKALAKSDPDYSRYGEYLIFAIYDYNLNAKTVLNKTIKLEYQIKIGGSWVTKKTDRLKIIIQPKNMTGNTPEIKIHNPIVWYDYSVATPSNINHYRKAELYMNEAITLERNNQTEFVKNNSNLEGKAWINAKYIPEYTLWERHRIEINTGKGEVVKYTDKNGKTKSSTFIDIGNKNEIMLAYGGKIESSPTSKRNKALSFGVSKYNFRGGNGKVIISQYEKTGNLINVQEYNINIDRFNGLHYVEPQYDIKPKKDYTKIYNFDDKIDVNAVEIDYGTVGFKDLDTRITNQSGGEGIEFRMTEDVLLVGEGEYKNYKIPAKLKFMPNIDSIASNIDTDMDRDGRYWIYKGKNEDKSSVKLILCVNTQEHLIPTDARFKIVEAKDETKSPLRVGVVVNGNTTEFFEEVANLYLNMGQGRFVKTNIIFQNPNIQSEASNNGNNDMKWIKLDATNYPNGYIEGYTGTNWGVVDGDVIDIPTAQKDITIKVIDGDYKKVLLENLVDKTCSIEIGDINKNILQIKYDKGTKHLSFRVNNATTPYYSGKKGKFYLRFETEKNGVKKYLFTQQYNISFDAKAGEIQTIIDLKNPLMGAEETKDQGYILVDRRENNGGKALGDGNHNTKYDSQKWWRVGASTNYPDTTKYNYKFYTDENFNTEMTPKNVKIEFIKENSANTYSTLKIGLINANYNGSRLNENIYVKWSDPKVANWERKDLISVNVEAFDPTYYGKLFSNDGVDENGANSYQKECEVGEGFENLVKDGTQNEHYIDLNTSYRAYQRYEGILEEVQKQNRDNFVVKAISQTVVARDKNGKVIKGKLVFEDATNSYKDELIVKLNKNSVGTTTLLNPTKYKLYFKTTHEEYNKLDYNTRYELFENENSENSNIVIIGYKNKTGDLATKPISIKGKKVGENAIKGALNFTTSRRPFIITTYNLDFGTINILFNDGTTIKKHGQTLVTLSGESIENITLTLDKSHVIENGKPTTYINRYDENGLNENTKLKVVNINLAEQTQQPNKLILKGQKVEKTKIYDLDADLLVPLDSKVGNYIGGIYINSTIIN